MLLGVAAFGQTPAPEPIYTPSGILNFQAITPGGRVDWFTSNTVGLEGMTGVVSSAAWGTLYNEPKEYHGTLAGFGKRAGVRLSTLAIGNLAEAGLGAAWGEDPRYVRAAGQPFMRRVGQVLKLTVMAENRDGSVMPAYARYIAIPGSNFLSNAWRADSEARNQDAAVRTLLGFVGRISSNAWIEFWPDIKQRISGKKP